MTEFRCIEGYEGFYKVDTNGNVYSYHSKRLLRPFLSSDGYLRVNLSKKGKVKTTMVHRLVAETFLSNPKKLPVVNHIDGNKSNPHINNLEWVTVSENAKHAFDKGLSKISERCKRAVSKIAAENGSRTTSKVVVQLDLFGNVLNEFPSIREAERKTNIKRTNISAVCRGIRKTAGGYSWKFKEGK